MLPENRFSHDDTWIKERFDELCGLTSWGYALKVMQKYSDAYQEAYEKEPVSYRKDGAARYEANTRLRLLIKSMSAKVIAPPKI